MPMSSAKSAAGLAMVGLLCLDGSLDQDAACLWDEALRPPGKASARAPRKLARATRAPTRSAPQRFAPRKFAARRSAPRSTASLRSAPRRLQRRRDTAERSVPLRLDSARLDACRSTPVRSVRARFADARLAYDNPTSGRPSNDDSR